MRSCLVLSCFRIWNVGMWCGTILRLYWLYGWMWTTSRLHPWKSKQVKGTGPTNESVTWKALEQWKMTLYGTRSCKARHACIAHSNNHRTIRSLVLGFGQFYFVRMEVTWSGDPKCRANWNFRLLCWEAGSTLHPDCPKLRKINSHNIWIVIVWRFFHRKSWYWVDVFWPEGLLEEQRRSLLDATPPQMKLTDHKFPWAWDLDT